MSETTPLLGELSINDEEKQGNEKKNQLGAAKTYQTYFTIINGFVGGGMLAMPYGFKCAGWLGALIALILLAIISDYTLRILVLIKMVDKSSSIKTYADIGHACYGKIGAFLVNLCIVVSQFGYCCSYLIFIGNNVHNIQFMTEHYPINRILLILVLPIVTVLVFFRNLKFISTISPLSNIAILISVTAILVFGFQTKGIQNLSNYALLNIEDFAIYYGIVAFAYTQHGLILEVHASMKEPQKFPIALDPAVAFTTIIYLLFGLFGYFFFNKDTPDVITQVLTGIEADILRVSLSFILLLAYPLQMFPVVSIVENALLPPRSEFSSCMDTWQTTKSFSAFSSFYSFDTWKRNAIRISLIFLSILAAVEIPSFSLFSSLVGTLSNSFIAFIFPPLFYLKLYGNSFPRWKQFSLILLIIFGLFGMGVGTTVVIKNIITTLS